MSFGIVKINPNINYYVVIVRKDESIVDMISYGSDKELMQEELKHVKKVAELFQYELFVMTRVGAR